MQYPIDLLDMNQKMWYTFWIESMDGMIGEKLFSKIVRKYQKEKLCVYNSAEV